MTTHILDTKNSILNKFISEVRNVNVQKDSLWFRRNIERIGEILAYEISQSLNFEKNSYLLMPLLYLIKEFFININFVKIIKKNLRNETFQLKRKVLW